jgi:hypothetical protein
MYRAVSIFGLIFLPISAVSAQMLSEDEQRERWTRAKAAQHEFESELFNRAGFPSIAELTLEGRKVRRLLLRDPYGFLHLPGVELERHDDKKVTLRLQYVGWSSDQVLVDPAVWDEIASQESAVFTVPEFRPVLTPSEPSEPPPVCHGWSARFQADYQRTASWSGCGGGTTSPRLDYAVAIAELAVATNPDCAFNRANPFFSFKECFVASPKLDDPELERTYSVLRDEYNKAPGAVRLAEARRALNVPELTMGSQSWLDARAAIARVKAVQDSRREHLRRLQQLASTASDASAADTAKMQQTIQTWSRFLNAQQANYADLLQRLVWAYDGERTD